MTITVTGDGVVNGNGDYAYRISAGHVAGGTVTISSPELVTTRGIELGAPIGPAYGGGALTIFGSEAEVRVYGDTDDSFARVNVGVGKQNGLLNISEGGRLVAYPGTSPTEYVGTYEADAPTVGVGPTVLIGGDGGNGVVSISGQLNDFSSLEVNGQGEREISVGRGADSYGRMDVSYGGASSGKLTVGSDGGRGNVNILNDAGSVLISSDVTDATLDIGTNGGYGYVSVNDGRIGVYSQAGDASVNLEAANQGRANLSLSNNASLYVGASEGEGSINVAGGRLLAFGSSITVSGGVGAVTVGAITEFDIPSTSNSAYLNLIGASLYVRSSDVDSYATVSIGGAGATGGNIFVNDSQVYDAYTGTLITQEGSLRIGGSTEQYYNAGRLILGGDQSTLTISGGGLVEIANGPTQKAVVIVGGEEPEAPSSYYQYYGYGGDPANGGNGRIFVTGEGSVLNVGREYGYYGYGEVGGGPLSEVGAPAPLLVIGDGDETEGLLAANDGGEVFVGDNSYTLIARGEGSEGTLFITDGALFKSDGTVAVGGAFEVGVIALTPGDDGGPGEPGGPGSDLVTITLPIFDAEAGGEATLIVNDGGRFEAEGVLVSELGTVSIEGELQANFFIHGEFGVDLQGVDELSLTGNLGVAKSARIFIDIADFGANDGDTIDLEGSAIFDTRQSFYVIDLDVASDVTEGDVFTYLTATGTVEAETRIVFDLNRGLAFELSSTGDALVLTALESSEGVTTVLTGDPFRPAEGGDGREELRSLYGDATLIGNGGDDTLIGVSGDTLSGGRDDDLIIANDTGGYGYSSQLFGGQGNDTLITATADDRAQGGAGDDLLNLSNGAFVADGGDGEDTLSFEDVTEGMQFDLLGIEPNLGGPLINFAFNIENLTGTNSDDTLFGDNEANTIDGGRSADAIDGRDGNDFLIGGKGADTLDGGEGNDTLDGGAASDLLIGGGGFNILIGGFGADTLQGSENGLDIASYETSTRAVARALGEDEITAFGDARIDVYVNINGIQGSDFNDTLGGGFLGNLLVGGLGDDILLGFGADDTLLGEGGDDTIEGGSGFDRLDGGLGDDSLDGGTDSDVIFGGDGDDTLSGGFDNVSDFVSAGAGDDLIFAATGDLMAHGVDSIIGGDGEDTLTFENETQNVQFDLAGLTTGVGAGLNSAVSEVEHVTGGAGADFLRGDDESNRLDGGEGIDRLIGRDGDDTLIGGADTDLLRGGDDDDLLDGGGDADTLEGDDGADTLIGGAGADSLIGGNSSFDNGFGQVLDRDVASYETAEGRVRADLLGARTGIGDASGDEYDGIEDLTGGDFDDTLFGDDLDNILDGGEGDDVLRGKGGDDTILGGAGDDNIRGDEGFDVIRAGDDDDFVKAADGGDIVEGGAGADTLYGGDDEHLDLLTYEGSAEGVNVNLLTGAVSGGDAEGDTIVGFENLTGSERGDRLEGDGGANDLNGLDGDDVILGRGGADRINGGDGNDTISAGGGSDDFIVGGGGVDVLLGNGGNDAFVFQERTNSGVGEGQRDVIRDFSEAQGDTIDFTLLSFSDENGDFDPDAELSFVGSSFSGDGHEVIANVVNNDFTLIQIDFDGDQVSDFEVEVDGVHENIGDSITFDFI